jgi:hypothetical protein
MPLSVEADKLVKVASVSLPRVSEIIAAFSDHDRARAFELAERRAMRRQQVPRPVVECRGPLVACESCEAAAG